MEIWMENCRFKLGIVFLCGKKNSKIFACGALKKKETKRNYHILHTWFSAKKSPPNEGGGENFGDEKYLGIEKSFKKR